MPTIKRSAEAVWNGGGPDGKGTLTTQSGTLVNTPYSAGMRFGEDKGTNPEELIGAAHAGCFSMALAFGLGGAGHKPDELRTTAVVTIEKEAAGWTVKTSALTLKAKIPGISEADFKKAAEAAKAGCPISRVLAGATITLDAELVK
jgi:osmotically inducible protein OsmC